MDQISSTVKKVLNDVSQERSIAVKLGDIIESMIANGPDDGTPVNAIDATGTLTISGVVVDGETVTIGDDVYEFVTDAAKTVTAPTNKPVDIAANATKSSGTLTMATRPTAGDKVTIGEKVYTFVPVGTDNADGEVSIGADAAGAQANLVAAINGTDGISTPHPLVSAGDFAANVCTITALVGGTVGNAIATTETFTAVGNVFGAAVLGSGADCTAANAVTALVAAITANTESAVAAADGAGDTVVLTSPGAAGNAIDTTETMANGSFGAAHLAGGVDGTIAVGMKMLVDASYLYVCLAGNTALQKNWRRISLGSAF